MHVKVVLPVAVRLGLCACLVVCTNGAPIVPYTVADYRDSVDFDSAGNPPWQKAQEPSLFQQAIQYLISGRLISGQPQGATWPDPHPPCPKKLRSRVNEHRPGAHRPSARRPNAHRPFFLHESTLSLADRVSGTHLIPNTKAVVGLNAIWVKPKDSFTYTKVLQWTPDYTLSPQKTRVLASQRVASAVDDPKHAKLEYSNADPENVALRYISGRKAVWTIANDTYIAEGGRLYHIQRGRAQRQKRAPGDTPRDNTAEHSALYPRTDHGSMLEPRVSHSNPDTTIDSNPNTAQSAKPMRFRGIHHADTLPRAPQRPPKTRTDLSTGGAVSGSDTASQRAVLRTQRSAEPQQLSAGVKAGLLNSANLSLFCDVSAFVTNRFRQQFSSWSAISDALQTVVQVSAGAYHHANASGLYLKSVAQWDPPSTSTDMSEILEHFTDFIGTRNESNDGCANVLFDNVVYDDNHVGIAWLNGACGTHNTAVVSHLGLADTSLILAHEAGHLMTALHTEQYTQCPGGTIMDADVSFSAFEFCDHVGSLLSSWGDDNAACLATLPHTGPEYPHYHDDNDLVYGLVALVLFLVVFFAVVWCIVGPLDSHCIH